MLQATTTAAILLVLVLQVAWLKVDGATCDSLEVTDPTSLRDSANSTGWVSQDVGAGELRQGHVSAGIFAWDQEYIVVYGGTDTRTDDVNDVLAGGSRVWLLDTSTMLSWESLEMVGEIFVSCLRACLLLLDLLHGIHLVHYSTAAAVNNSTNILLETDSKFEMKAVVRPSWLQQQGTFPVRVLM